MSNNTDFFNKAISLLFNDDEESEKEIEKMLDLEQKSISIPYK
jgi:hypothetical protein